MHISLAKIYTFPASLENSKLNNTEKMLKVAHLIFSCSASMRVANIAYKINMTPVKCEMLQVISM